MKEATGELSTTVIAIVAIAAILAIFTVFLLPTLKKQIALTQACTNGPGYSIQNGDGSTIVCGTATSGGTEFVCTYTDEDGSQNTKTCSN